MTHELPWIVLNQTTSYFTDTLRKMKSPSFSAKSVKEVSFTFCGTRNYQPVGGMISEEILPALPNQQSNSEKQMKGPR